jgi:hypothetical protein
MDLSNFYKDFSFKYEHFEALFQIYSDLMLATNDYIEQVKRNTVIPDIETYRIFPFQRILADSATYVLEEVLDDTRVVTKLGLGSITLTQRVINWNTGLITKDQKIDALSLLNLYIPLAAIRGYPNEPSYNVIDFSFFDGEKKLGRNADFVLQSNRIYLLDEIAKKTQGKYLVMTNIAIDLREPEDLIGKFVDIQYNDGLTKNEYNEIVKALIVSALGGPTIANLKKAIRSISGFDQADLYDKYVADPVKQKRWTKVNYTEFDFVVVFPEEYSAHTDKLQIVIDYLKMVKPAYTKFFIVLQSLYSDLYNILLKANDAEHLDVIRELGEDTFTNPVFDEVLPDLLRDAFDEIYAPIAPIAQAYYLNGPERLNQGVFTFNEIFVSTQDWNFDYVKEHTDEIYAGADDESHTVMTDNADDAYTAVIADSELDIVKEDIEETYSTVILEESSETLAEVFSDNYTGAEDEEQSTLVETPTEESYNNSDDTYVLSTALNTTPHYRLNGPQRLNVDLMIDRITDTETYNY